MENISDALILSFAVIIFVIALSMTMNIISQARKTSDIVIGTVDSSRDITYEEVSLSASLSYRKVGTETIIPTLYRYFKENMSVVFLQGTVSTSTQAITSIKPLYIYTTVTDPANEWEDEYKGNPTASPAIPMSYGHRIGNGSTQICVFDVEEENLRHEPFAVDRKKNIDNLLESGSDYAYDHDNVNADASGKVHYNYSGIYGDSATAKISTKANYLELISRENKTSLSGNKTTRKTIITYVKYTEGP